MQKVKEFFIKYWWLPVAIAAIIAGWQYKLYLDKNKAVKPGIKQDAPPKPNDVKPGKNTTNNGTTVDNSFPLKVGSKNQYVGTLQKALGVPIDNNFGTKQTLPALKKQTGKTQIDSLDDLNATIDLINSNNNESSAISQRQARADQINAQYNLGNATQILFLNDSIWDQAIINNDGSLTDAGYIINWKAGDKISLENYVPSYGSDAMQGYLLIHCVNSDTNIGDWGANPLDITLV